MELVLFGVRRPVYDYRRYFGVKAVEFVTFLEGSDVVVYRRNILFVGNPKDEPLYSRHLLGHKQSLLAMMADFYANERAALDRIQSESPQRLREHLSILSRLPSTPEHLRIRGAIIRLLAGNRKP